MSDESHDPREDDESSAAGAPVRASKKTLASRPSAKRQSEAPVAAAAPEEPEKEKPGSPARPKTARKPAARKTKKKKVAAEAKAAAAADDTAVAGAADHGDQYLCVHCDHTFHPEGGTPPARCPSCMRKGGLEIVRKANKGGRPAWIVPVAIVGLVAAVGIGYAVWDSQTANPVEGDAPLRPLETSELLGYLQVSNAGREVAEIFDGGEAIDALAEEAAGDSPSAKASALTEHIADRRAAGAFERWSFSMPRDTPVRGAERVAERLAEEGAAHLYPLEVALAAVVALREADVDAMVAEIWKLPGVDAPPDPSGHFGYFGVAVYEGAVGEGEPQLFDPYGGREAMPEADGFRVLSDPQVAGAYLSTQALHEHVHENDLAGAMGDVRKALRLDPRAPYARSVEAAVFLASGGVQEGIDDLEAAVQIRADPPRRNLLAGVFLATGDTDGAQREVSLALEEAPEYADAHATLAALHMLDGAQDSAFVALEAAERFDPGLVNLPMLWAQYHMQTGDTQQAVRNAVLAVDRRPHDWQERLRAAQVFRAASEFNEMRRQAHAIVELAPSGQEQAIRQQVTQVLGDTAFEDFDEESALRLEDYEAEDEDDGEPLGDMVGLEAMGDPSDLSLGSGSFGAGSETSGPSLLDTDLSGGPSLQLGGPSSLRLRPPGQKLQLQLGGP